MQFLTLFSAVQRNPSKHLNGSLLIASRPILATGGKVTAGSHSWEGRVLPVKPAHQWCASWRALSSQAVPWIRERAS